MGNDDDDGNSRFFKGDPFIAALVMPCLLPSSAL